MTIPDPDKDGYYIAIISPSIVEDLRRMPTEEEMATWDEEPTEDDAVC